MAKTAQKDIEKFITEVSKMETVEFIGLTKFLNISLVDGKTIKKFDTVLEELLEKFSTLTRVQKRNLMKLVKASSKKVKKK